MLLFNTYQKKTQKSFTGRFFQDELLSRHTYYRIGGPAQQMVLPKTLDDLECIIQYLSEEPVPYFILGQGSNILASDQGFPGLIIKTTLLQPFSAFKKDHVSFSSGQLISRALQFCIKQGYGGLEFLTGVPGTLGGAVYMNAGTNQEIQECITSLSVLCLESQMTIKTFSRNEMNFEYRRNNFLLPQHFILEASFKVYEKDPKLIQAEVYSRLDKRKQTQPVHYPSCGSVFKNTPLSPAWRVIDQLGLRGFSIRGAQFSDLHPNFIINHSRASSEDVQQLILMAKKRAQEELGIQLSEEVVYLSETSAMRLV